ncbi:MAG: tetratricopeptide repeat protein [Cyanobacteria bacterium SZAS LIN-2]|nr:tetratricopeptide repeat protein [Cyanobacteria bacterium SZAS LIN-2]
MIVLGETEVPTVAAEGAASLVEQCLIDEGKVISVYLIKGLYRVAREWQEKGENSSARRIYSFIAGLHERSPQIKCAEIAQSTAALASIAGTEEKFLEAEQLYIRAIALCLDHLGEHHPVSAEILHEYAVLLRRLHLTTEANVVDLRADEVCHLPLPGPNKLKSVS